MIRDLIFQNHDPYHNVPNLQLDLQGWNSDSPTFKRLIDEIKPKTICEVGTWKGASAIHMANLSPNTEIVCVDTWLGSSEFWIEPDRRKMLNLKNGHPQVYETFLSNVVRKGLKSRITPFPVDSQTAANFFQYHNIRFDLIYIDASHETECVVNDIVLFSNLSSTIFGDDYNWPSVKSAVDRCTAQLKMDLSVENEKWILRHK